MNAPAGPIHGADALWLQSATQRGPQHWLDNAHGRVFNVPLGHEAAPLTQCEDFNETTYVASLPAGWVRYGVVEAERRIPGNLKALSPLLRVAQAPLLRLLQAAGLHRATLLNNWLVSTNLHPDLPASDWQIALEAAITLIPGHPVALRSVCDAVNPGLPSQLTRAGWHLVPARLVYLCDPSQSSLWKKNHVRKDQRLLAGESSESGIELVPPESIHANELPALRGVFQQLFIGKHSHLNPDFSNEFLSLCHHNRFLDLYALRYQKQPVGILGVMQRHGWVTTPLIGYDTDLPQELGLYRRLMAVLLAQARDRGARLHYSSGAGQFKMCRGGASELEYTALYTRHLSREKRMAIDFFSAAMNRYAKPLLCRHG